MDERGESALSLPWAKEQGGLVAQWLGRCSWERAEQEQDRAQHRAREAAVESLLLLELEPVITAGRHCGWDELYVSRTALRERGVVLAQASRGGKLTYHGPGQLVVYAVLDLRQRGRQGPWLVQALAGATVDWLRSRGGDAVWSDAVPGVWMERPGRSRVKVASVGLRVEDGLSRHGLALNLRVDCSPYSWFRPCGLAGDVMACVADVLPDAPIPAVAARELVPFLTPRFTKR